MPYAEGRTCYDADSHLMELSDWLVQHADPGVREKIRPLYLGAAGALAEKAVAEAEARRGDPEASRALEATSCTPRAGRRRFEASLAGVGPEAKERFYAGNFADMMGMA